MSLAQLIVLVVAPVAAVLVLATRPGALAALGRVRLHGRAWIVVAALVQALRSASPAWAQGVLGLADGVVVVVVLAVCALAFVAANVRDASVLGRAALVLVAAGVLANALPTALNAGMPFSIEAARTAGISQSAIAAPAPGHVPLTAESSLRVLADVVPVPGLRIVLSVGDVLLWAGLAGLLIASAQAVLVRPGRPAGEHHPVEAGPVGLLVERNPS